jgi:hypothetical protein
MLEPAAPTGCLGNSYKSRHQELLVDLEIGKAVCDIGTGQSRSINEYIDNKSVSI